MENSGNPLYQSAPAKKSMGNRYSIYADRIELRCRFPFVTKTLVIKKDDLISIDTFKPPVLRTTFWALKLDLADLNDKKKKWIFQTIEIHAGKSESVC